MIQFCNLKTFKTLKFEFPSSVIDKENRIFIRVEFRQSLGMNFLSQSVQIILSNYMQ